MSFGRVIDVDCQCGAPLFRYYKSSHGRLIKVFLENIRNDLIFLPGFSTSAIITDISGRGVGMDVVKQSNRSCGCVAQNGAKNAGPKAGCPRASP